MDEVQIQKREINSIESKLSKIADLLEMLVQIQTEEAYPDESKMKKSFIKKCEAIISEIKSGKMKTHTYRNMAEFTKTLG